MLDSNVSLTAQMRAWVKEKVAQNPVNKAPEITRDVIQVFLRSNPEAIRQIQDELLFRSVYDNIVLPQIANTRRPNHCRIGDTLISEAEINREAEAIRRNWGKFKEHNGGQHINLMVMTKRDLILAAQERRKDAETNFSLAKLWNALAAKMSDDETVGDRFTTEQIEQINQDINTGLGEVIWVSSTAA